ncbi:hypothetical protein D3C74_420400 [compost metagenome]
MMLELISVSNLNYAITLNRFHLVIFEICWEPLSFQSIVFKYDLVGFIETEALSTDSISIRNDQHDAIRPFFQCRDQSGLLCSARRPGTSSGCSRCGCSRGERLCSVYNLFYCESPFLEIHRTAPVRHVSCC